MPTFLLFAFIVFHRVVKTNHHLTGTANLFPNTLRRFSVDPASGFHRDWQSMSWALVHFKAWVLPAADTSFHVENICLIIALLDCFHTSIHSSLDSTYKPHPPMSALSVIKMMF